MPKCDPPLARVRRFALALDDAVEGATFGYPAFKVRDKTFAWFPKKKEVEDGSVAVRMGFDERERHIAKNPSAYYVTPHYRDYTAILARPWELGDVELRKLIASGYAFMMDGTASSSPRRATARKRR